MENNEVKVSDMTKTSNINSQDLLMIVQNGTNKQIEFDTIVEELKNNVMNSLIDELILEDNKKKYYVGKLVFDTKNVNPATYLGFGTWTLWGAGRVPVGVDTTDTKFNTVEKTGGSNSVSIAHTHSISGNTAGHTLTVNEIPKHAHNIERSGSVGSGGYVSAYTNNTSGDTGFATENAGGGQAHSHSISLTSGSAGGSVSTVQEYITCYIWKRTA